MRMTASLLKVVVITATAAGIVGCETKAGTGAVVGGASGAAGGGPIGSKSHARAGEGALIGGAIGAIGGGLIGHSMDEQDKKEARESSSSSRSRNSSMIRQSDVIAWTDQGIRDDIIIDRIERSGTVFHLTAADQNELRDHGVSESVIRAMKDTARR